MSAAATDAATLGEADARLLRDVPTDLLIGAWRPAAEDRRFDVLDPSTGTALARVADGSVADALDALELADAVAGAWAARSPLARADLLWALHDTVQARAEDFARVITLEMGKPLAESRGEVQYGAGYLRWYAEEAVRVGGRTSPSPDGRSTILTGREPVGPCLLITPWNFPLAMALRKIAPALAAGCTAVLKPADLTPLTALLLGQAFLDAGGPEGVLSIVTTTDAAALSAALMADARLRKVSFTGSTAVGRTLIAQSAPQVLRTSMELGGNAPLLVFDDADLDQAVEGALLAKLRNGGQSCIAANRILVQDGIAEAFTERFVAGMRAVVVGRGADPATTLGPVIDARAVARLARLTEGARAGGATVLCGGDDGPARAGTFFAPTVLEVRDASAAVLHEEVFGPLAPIVRFETEDEGVALANDTPYGLAAYAFTDSLARAGRVARRLRAGMVGVNQGVVSNVAAPFGGIGHSGLGREGGAEGIDEYLSLKYVASPVT